MLTCMVADHVRPSLATFVKNAQIDYDRGMDSLLGFTCLLLLQDALVRTDV